MHDTLGVNGFIWYVGAVEDIESDPYKIGRVKVRVYNIHNPDKSVMPTSALPWAQISQDPTSAAHEMVGKAPVGIKIGSLVWGFFMDGNHYQQPVVCGTFQGIPGGKSDLTPLATGTDTIPNAGSTDEPASTYKTKYPFNQVQTFGSGHVVEYDNTPGAERIRVYHKSGSYDVTNPNGDKVSKSVNDGYVIIDNDNIVYIGGNLKVTIGGDADVTVNGTCTVHNDVYVDGDVIASGISLINHVHGDEDGTTGAPQG